MQLVFSLEQEQDVPSSTDVRYAVSLQVSSESNQKSGIMPRPSIFALSYVAIFVQVIDSRPLLQLNSSLKNPFVGFYLFPHGGVILDPDVMDYSTQPAFTEDSREKAISLNLAMQLAAENLVQSKPDLIIFSTPHGFHLADDNLILSTVASLFGTVGSIWIDYTAGFNVDVDLSAILYSELISVKSGVDLMSFGLGQDAMPLLWAEVIPWYFIRQAAGKLNYELPNAIYIGQPTNVNIMKIRDLGRDLAKVALLRKEFASKRIAVVISGDLSHYHSDDPASPYPYSPISSVFDDFIVNWAKMDRTPELQRNSSVELLVNAGNIQNDAGHCGYTGFLMLHGMLDEMVNQNWTFKSHFYSYQVPTYFGMVVSSWLPVSQMNLNKTEVEAIAYA